MSDQPDIDIEAERKDFERDAIAHGMSARRLSTDEYVSPSTAFRLSGWLARARIAAERERELQATIDRMRADWVAAMFDWVQCETLLKEAYASVCSIQCPSVWPTNESQPHCDLCQRITEALKPKCLTVDIDREPCKVCHGRGYTSDDNSCGECGGDGYYDSTI